MVEHADSTKAETTLGDLADQLEAVARLATAAPLALTSARDCAIAPEEEDLDAVAEIATTVAMQLRQLATTTRAMAEAAGFH